MNQIKYIWTLREEYSFRILAIIIKSCDIIAIDLLNIKKVMMTIRDKKTKAVIWFLVKVKHVDCIFKKCELNTFR